MPKKFLVVGLGNPNAEFQKTLHNAGFWVIESFLLERATLENKKKIHAKNAEIKSEEQELFFILPQTFMNNSGLSVREAQSFWKIRTTEIILVHDDSDLSLGQIKITYGQSSGGHKGVESVIKSLGSSNFTRIKIGIRPTIFQASEKERIKAGKFVLKGVTEDVISKIGANGAQALKMIIEEGREQAMNTFNGKINPSPFS